MKITGMMCSILVSVFLVYGGAFINIWLNGREDSDIIFKLAAIALASDIAVGVVHPLYYVYTLTNKLKLPSFITIGMGFVNVISMYMLLKYTNMGVYAVVLTTLVINCVNYIDAPLYSAFCLKIGFITFYPEIIRHVLSIAVNVSVLFIVKKMLLVPIGWVSFLFDCFLSGAICIAITSIIVLNKKEWDFIVKKLKRVF